MKNSFVCFKLYLLKTVKLAPFWWKVPDENLQELKLFIHSDALLQSIGVNDKPLIDQFSGSWVRPSQDQQQLCKLPHTLSPVHLWGRAQVRASGAGSAWNPAQKLQPLNSNRSSDSWWSAFLFPQRQCSEHGGNGAFAASDTSGVCSPALLCQAQEQPYDASKVNRRTVSTSSHLEMSCVQLPLRAATHYCPLGLVLFPKEFSISVLRVWGLVFLIFTAKNWNLTCVEKSKMQKKEERQYDKFLPLPPVKALWRGEESDLLKTFWQIFHRTCSIKKEQTRKTKDHQTIPPHPPAPNMTKANFASFSFHLCMAAVKISEISSGHFWPSKFGFRFVTGHKDCLQHKSLNYPDTVSIFSLSRSLWRVTQEPSKLVTSLHRQGID